MMGKLSVYTLIYVLLCMNNMICQLKRQGWLVGAQDVKILSQLSQLSQLLRDVPN